ncbi:hypothetical protein MNEG_14572 [Monoraphidium neglectum]|uniref:Uncharacterized protein n=1 Tax=Monoraphidium neglectum TaxID=145388 RepID=A0A0D2MDU8_9CHLO|nr:hypothetical protein MNEG_14572 [Monoraphidium neglectum]KIY93390.1 hypothetical protein MNEG_14572 [Monoraphidium neglectum]|eukprot:XP_013892410.1 hypothetical protein MNEG_14572 [Monoraphidium neglectum]
MRVPLIVHARTGVHSQDLEAFLTHIYRALAAATPLKDKVNVLAYFETLCADTTAANVLINSSLTMLFVRMLRNGRAPLLRVRLAGVLGLLVRHATFIAEELAATQVVEILTEALRDKNERVRRRVMATLGELLFYIATQQQDSGAGSVADVSAAWGISSATTGGVVRLLRPGEDEICQHYAVKTIENICSQGGEWAATFSTMEVVSSLVALLGSSSGDNLKATAASTLARLLRASPPLMGALLDKWGAGVILSGLSDTSSKVQISAANMLNQLLSAPDNVARARAALAADERAVVTAVMGLLDHALPLLRAKGILAVVLLCRLSPRWLLECCKQRLVPLMERLQRERDAYTQEAAAQLRVEMAAAVEATCEQIRGELAAAAAAGAAARGPLQLQQLQASGAGGGAGAWAQVLCGSGSRDTGSR